MKKQIVFATGLLAFAAMTTGCSSGYIPANGFASPLPGFLFQKSTHTSYLGNKVTDPSKVKVMRKVEGNSYATNILYLITAGNCSVGNAREDALLMTGADDIMDMEVTTTIHSTLQCFTLITTTVKGKAVKYVTKQE